MTRMDADGGGDFGRQWETLGDIWHRFRAFSGEGRARLAVFAVAGREHGSGDEPQMARMDADGEGRGPGAGLLRA